VIEQPEAFKHAMLAAKSIAYSTGASGIIVARHWLCTAQVVFSPCQSTCFSGYNAGS
jgi:hypothetical protein